MAFFVVSGVVFGGGKSFVNQGMYAGWDLEDRNGAFDCGCTDGELWCFGGARRGFGGEEEPHGDGGEVLYAG